MIVQANLIIKEMLIDGGYYDLAVLSSHEIDEAVFQKHIQHLVSRNQHPEHNAEEIEARAIVRTLLSTTNTAKSAASKLESNQPQDTLIATQAWQHARMIKYLRWLLAALLALGALVICSDYAFSQVPPSPNVRPNVVVATCGTPPANYPAAGQPAPNTVDTNGNLCAGVSVTATVATAGLAVSATVGVSSAGIATNPSGGVVSTSAPSWTNGTIAPFSFEPDGDLRVAATVTPAANQVVSTTSNAGSGAVAVVGAASSGAAVTGSPVLMAAQSGANAQTLVMSTTGSGLKVDGSGYTQPVSGTVTVTDGAGALNTIIDSGTVTAVTSITNPVTVTNVNDLSTIRGTNIPNAGSGAVAVVGIVSSGTVAVGGPVIVGGMTGTVARSLSVDDSGFLNVNATVTPSANQIVSTTNSAGSGAVAVVGAASSATTALGGPVLVGALSGANAQSLVMSTTGSGLKVDGSGYTQPVSGTVTATVGNTVNVNFLTASPNVTVSAALPAGTNNIGDVDVLTIAGATPVFVSGVQTNVMVNTSGTAGVIGGVGLNQYGGVTVPTGTSGVVAVTLTSTAGTIGALNANQTVAQATASNLNAQVVGSAAVGGTPGNPVITGGSTGNIVYGFRSDGAGNTVVVGTTSSGTNTLGSPVLVAGATGGKTYSIATDTSGLQLVKPYGYTVATVWASSVNLAITNTAIVTVGSGSRVVLHRANFTCASTVSVAVTVSMGFATATLPTTGVGLIWPGMITSASSFQGLQDGAGWPNVLGMGASDEDLRLTITAPTGGSCTVSITYSTEAT